jgi:hypothetical protein
MLVSISDDPIAQDHMIRLYKRSKRSKVMLTAICVVFVISCVLRHTAAPISRRIFAYGNVVEYDTINTEEIPVADELFVNAHMLTREMRRTLTASEGNNMIRYRLCQGDTFIAGRGGDAELLIVEDVINRVVPRARQWPRRHSGIYPETPDGLQRFGDVYYDAIRSLKAPDLFAFFTHRYQVEDVVLPQTLSKSVGLIHEDAMNPYWFDVPWSKCLRNKIVLIVHPFIDSIKCQLRRRDLIFPYAPDVLPPFEVKFVKSFQCLGETKLPHSDWNETLHATQRLVDEVGHFDVALIAAGSYGLPLAVYCKTVKNASAIVIGGSMQQLFGLRGTRWDTMFPTGYKYAMASHNNEEKILYNEQWIYPLKSDTIADAEKIEHGSPYWGPPAMQLDSCPV